MPIVSDATPRAEVGCLRCVSCVRACRVQANSRIGRGGAPGRSRPGEHQPRRHNGRTNPSLHGSVLMQDRSPHNDRPAPRACLNLTHAHQSVFKRSMPSDLIRGWKPVRVRKTRQNQEARAPFRFYRNVKEFGVTPDITSDDGANGDDASGDDANGDDANAGDASAGDSPNDDGGGASALRWSSPWCHPEPRRRRRDWPATGPGRVRRERSA